MRPVIGHDIARAVHPLKWDTPRKTVAYAARVIAESGDPTGREVAASADVAVRRGRERTLLAAV